MKRLSNADSTVFTILAVAAINFVFFLFGFVEDGARTFFTAVTLLFLALVVLGITYKGNKYNG